MTEKKKPPKWAERAIVIIAGVVIGLVASIIIGALTLAALSTWGRVFA